MRTRLIFAGVVVVGALGAAAACSIDESGTQSDGSADVTPIEGGADGPSDAPIDVVQGCKTLDATACVDAGLPDGWTWAVVSLSGGACPPGDYQASQFVYGLGLEAGACTCDCTTNGSWSCAGQIEAGTGGGGNACQQQVISFDAGDDASCIDTGWNDPHIAFGPVPQVSGSPTCTAHDGGTGAWTAQTATSCAPGCTVDYCGVDAGGFGRCIVAPGNLGCPAPFVGQPTMGTADKVAVSCGACGCSVDTPGACNATVHAAVSTDCSNPYNSAVAPSTCATPGGGGKVNSFLYTPQVPTVSCTADAGASSVGFASTVTVCCLP